MNIERVKLSELPRSTEVLDDDLILALRTLEDGSQTNVMISVAELRSAVFNGLSKIT